MKRLEKKTKKHQKVFLLGGILFLFCFGLLISFADNVQATEWWQVKEPSKTISLSTILGRAKEFLNLISETLGGLVVLFIVIAGIRYVIAKGSEEAQAAKTALFNALIGLAIIAGAWGIFSLVIWFVKGIFEGFK